jgi:hypothetical protein
MKFAVWLEQKNLNKIYLDLDDTLICHNHNGPTLRNHVKKFIETLKKFSNVEILTHGLTKHQEHLCKSLNLDLTVTGRDKYHSVFPSPNHILIDNTPADDEKTLLKLKTLGIEPNRLIKVSPCVENDNGLLHIIPHIHKLLNTNEWVEKNSQTLPKKQPFKTYKKAKNLAEERCSIFELGMKEAAGVHKVVTDIKSKKSFENKTVDRGKKPDKVYDVLRGAILVDDKDQIETVVDNLKKVFLIKKIEHKTKPEFFGYYGASHVDVVIHDMICEIQIMTKKLWKSKMEADKIYVKYRATDKPPKEEVEKSRELFRTANG